MIGSVYYGESNLRQRYLLVAASGAVLLVVGLLTMPWLMVLGITLLFAGGAGAIKRAPRFQVELQPAGLHLQPGDHLLPYAAIVAVTGLRKHNDQAGLKPYPIDVCTADFGVRVPAHPAVPALALEKYLSTRASPFITPPTDPDVAQFYDQECAKHGADQVALYHGRTAQIEAYAPRYLRWFALGWLIGSFVALSLALNLYARVDSVNNMAVVMIVLGFVLLLVSFVGDPRLGLKRQAGHTADSLVVGPSGLALRQGKLKGKLRWDEVQNIVMKPAAASSSTGSLSTGVIGRQSLHLQVAGATIVLVEVYDRALTQIKDTIEYQCHNRRQA